jgi:GAF domain-containing protein
MHQQAAMEGSGVGAAVEDLQFTLGEGPGLDAFSEGAPVVVPDLEEASSRWVHFASAARALGVVGVFAYPLQVGGVTSGVLSLYCGTHDRVDEDRLNDFAELASLVAESVLAMQSEASAEELAWALSSAAEHRTVVHQAAGMISVQLDCSIEDAFVRLRATAFTGGDTIDVVAREVVARRLRFEP